MPLERECFLIDITVFTTDSPVSVAIIGFMFSRLYKLREPFALHIPLIPFTRFQEIPEAVKTPLFLLTI